MKQTAYPEVWDLSSLFPGESPSDTIRSIETAVDRLEHQAAAFEIDNPELGAKAIGAIIHTVSALQLAFSQVFSYTSCLLAETPGSTFPLGLRSRAVDCQSRFSAIVRRIHKELARTEKSLWEQIIGIPSLQDYSFVLEEWRDQGKNAERDEGKETEFAHYHGLGQAYRTIVDRLQVPLHLDGEVQELSVGQATNLRSHPSRSIRKQAHLALNAVWALQENQVADLLNGITSFRLGSSAEQVLERPLEEALRENRLKKESLSAMWQAVNNHKQPFADYLQAKARLLGQERLASYDFWAPVTENPLHFPYPEAAEFLLSCFKGFGAEMENFTQRAFQEGWIEAENRSGKSAVAFCAGFPKTKESRIFVTYEGSFMNLLTLAHELGHAFHNHALKDEPSLLRKYPMSLAETASTFTEMIVLDSALSEAQSDRDKLFLLDEKIKRSTMNFMHIQARFLFEQRLGEERKKGEVAPSRINRLMADAFDEAYAGSMDEQPAHAWIATPHFYITSAPFYNFPYTFGYLFAVSLYARACEEGTGFESHYLALLRDSGKMPAEELVWKHLEEDITLPTFWEKGMDLCLRDIREFIRLSERVDASDPNAQDDEKEDQKERDT